MNKDINGVIAVNKEKGMTSFDVVHEISKIFDTKKVGHTGTLDPMAEGVLLVCIGKATKIVELLTSNEKEYIAEVKLGIETDTLDTEGKVLKEESIPDNLDIKRIIDSYNGKTYMQEVPKYSAIKVNGKKLYEYARNNLEVELPKKEVTIKSIELIDYKDDYFKFKCLVTKGTYIRSLIRDICFDLNTIGTMNSLIRTKQGNIDIKDTYKLSDIRNGNYKLIDIEDLLDYDVVVVDKEIEYKISNGVRLDNIWNINSRVIFKNNNNQLLGIYEKDGDKLKTWKNFI